MATVTGTLADFGFSLLTAYSPKIVFIPSAPATGPGGGGAKFLLATKRIVCTPASDGTFSQELYPNESSIPFTYYSLRIEWREPSMYGAAGGYKGIDFPQWKLVVPNQGGALADLLALPSNPSQVWVSETAPENPTPGTWWLVPSTGDLFEWTN